MRNLKAIQNAWAASLEAVATFPYVGITMQGEVYATWTYSEAKEVAGEGGWAGRPDVLLDEEGRVDWDSVAYHGIFQ